MKRPKFISLALAATFISTLIGCSGTIEMASSWNDNAVKIDGSNAEWGSSLKPLSDPPVAIGIRNDAQFLYVCLTTQDPFYEAQIINGGLTVWFDPAGQQEKSLGIRFPNYGENAPHWNPREPLTASFPFLEPSFRELAIIGPDGEPELFSVVEAKGIKVKIGATESGLVYEMQVPLKPSDTMRHAVGATETQTVGIGFETAELGGDRLQGPSGRATAGTRGGGRRGGRGGAGAGPSLDGAGRPEVLDLWTKVLLSSPRQ
ncbi:MAG TPA: hypothetical protein VJN65_05335 [Bacteroidota bacterium]|nr:hypothetical protein [Bacteroidota bacterium]